MLSGENQEIQTTQAKRHRNKSGSNTSLTIEHQMPLNSQHQENKLSAQEIIQLVLHYRITILLFALLGSLIGWFYASNLTPKFSATATLSVKIPAASKNESVQNKNSPSTNDLLILSTLESLALADKTLLDKKIGRDLEGYLTKGLPGSKSTKGIVPRVVDYLKALLPQDEILTIEDIKKAKNTGSYSHSVNVLKNYLKLFKFDLKTGSGLLEIVATSEDHVLSANLANIHGKKFIELFREKQSEALNENTKFLKTRVDEAASRLAAAQNELLEFAKANDFVLNTSDQTNSKYTDLSLQLNQVLLERAELEGVLGEARATRGRSALGDTSSEINGMSFELRQKEKEYALLIERTSLNRKSPQLVDLRKEIRSTRDLIKNRREDAIGSLQARYKAASNKEAILREEIEKAKKEGFEQSKNQIEYNIIETKVNSLKTLHSKLTAELDSAYANEESSQINVAFAAAAVPASPYFERYTGFLIILGFICGIICGVGVSYTQDALDDTLRTSDDIERALGIKSLGMLPKFQKDQGGLPSGSYEKLDVVNPDMLDQAHFANQSEGEVINFNHDDLVMIKRPRSAESEAVRSIRTSLMLSSIDAPPKIIVVTSGKQGEGKTTLSSNLAISFAQDGNKTLVIDADLRRPGLSSLFEVAEEVPGLADCLTGRKSLDEVVHKTSLTNFFAIPVGFIPPNPAELLNSKKMIAILETLKAKFDTIIIDAPPVLPVTDSLILSKMADGVVLVIRSGKTVKEIPKQSLARLEQVQAHVLGLVANGVDTRKNYYYAGYYKDVYSYYGNPKKKSSLFSFRKNA